MGKLLKWLVATGIMCAGATQAPAGAQEPATSTGLHAAFAAAIEEEGLVGVVWTTLTPDGSATGAAGPADA